MNEVMLLIALFCVKNSTDYTCLKEIVSCMESELDNPVAYVQTIERHKGAFKKCADGYDE